MAVRGASLSKRHAEMRRNADIVEMYCQGKSQAEVAKAFGLSQVRVSSIVIQARAEWLAKKEIATEDHINVSLMKLDRVYDEAESGWHRSYQDAVTITSRKNRQDKDGKLKKRLARADELVEVYREEKRSGQAGDPAFLHIMKDVVETRLKLLGAFPKEERNETTNVVINWGDLSNPIISVEPLPTTPSSEVEARIEAESKPPSNNGNGQHHD